MQESRILSAAAQKIRDTNAERRSRILSRLKRRPRQYHQSKNTRYSCNPVSGLILSSSCRQQVILVIKRSTICETGRFRFPQGLLLSPYVRFISRPELVCLSQISLLIALLSHSLLPPAIKALIPVNVGSRISGYSISSFSTSVSRLRNAIRLYLEYQASFGDFFCRNTCAANRVRNASRETMVTAIHVSAICQKFSQVTSTALVEVRVLGIPIKATIIIIIERQRKKHKKSFRLIFT